MENRLLISIPFATQVEERNSRRYHWKNAERGSDPFVILQWTISGEGTFEWNSRQWRVPPDHALIALLPEQSGYGYPADATEPWRFSWINFYGPLAVQLFRDLRDLYGPVLPIKRRSSEGAALSRLIDVATSKKKRDLFLTSNECYQFLMDWARELQSPERDRDPVETAKRICATRLHEPLGVKELAAETGLTREHFTRIFTTETGTPPALYLRQLRVQTAQKMLETSARHEVALRCGFPSVRALNRALNG